MKLKQIAAIAAAALMLMQSTVAFAEEAVTAGSESTPPVEISSSIADSVVISGSVISEESSSSSSLTEEQPSSVASSSSETSSSSQVISSSSSSSSSSSEASSSEDTAESAEMPAQADPVTEFVTRMYKIALNRVPDNAGVADWTNRLRSGTAKGVDIMSGFFNSPEYTSLNKSDADFVKDLYLAAFGRTADEGGLQDWTTRLSYYVSRSYVIEGFAGSSEFINMCASYGITSGHLTLTENRDKNINITAFASRLYKVALGHAPETAGLNDWTGKIISGEVNGAQAVHGFFLSDEYKKQNKSDVAFVSDLYNVMLNRTADSASSTWTSALDSGVSRDYAINGISGSAEFQNLCRQYGINGGSLALTQPRDKNIKVTSFVQSFYKGLLKRNGDETGLNDWTNRLLTGSASGTNVAMGFIGSSEMTGKKLTNAEYVALMYNVAFGRTASAAEVDGWAKYLSYGCTRDFIVAGFLNSPEFKAKCANAGVSHTDYIVTNACDKNWKVTKFVNDYYKYFLGRTSNASTAELNNFTSQLIDGKLTGTSLALIMIGSTEARNYINTISNNKKVEVVFYALLGRAPDAAEIPGRADYIDKNGYEKFVKEILKAAEYQNYAKSMNVIPGSLYGNLKVTTESGTVKEGDAVEILSHIVAGEVGPMANVAVFKAQAVAAHSWILYQNNNGVKAPTVAWNDSVSDTIRQSVSEVADKVIYYNDAPAMTTYFASCNNKTNTSAEVWGKSLPYLITVDSNYDSAVASNWKVERIYNDTQMKSIINKIYRSAYAGDPKYVESQKANWATVASTNPANGYVNRVQSNVTYFNSDTSNGKWVSAPSVTGLYFMDKANQAGVPMRSANFTIKYNNNSTWTITTYGYGHGVGMSQWGAYGYATKENRDYQWILQHYYPNTTIRTIG